MNGRRLLIVRHGPGRGRLAPYCQHVLDHLCETRPGLRHRIHVHETGAGCCSLDGFSAVLFWLGDPVRQLYPECYAEALGIEREARAQGIHVANPPTLLADYSKSHQSRVWRDQRSPSPEVIPFASREEFLEVANSVQYPVVVRGDTVHAQEGIQFLWNGREARDLGIEDLPIPGVVSPFVDVRAGYRRRNPLSIWSRLYHVKRVILLGDHVVPESVRFSKEPIVTNASSTLGRFANLRKHLKTSMPPGRQRGVLMRALNLELKVSPTLRRSLHVDRRFADGDTDDPDVFRSAARQLGLDFVAFDYSTLAGGKVVLWEANPYPHLLPAGGFMLPVERSTRDRTLALYDAFAAWFEGLALHRLRPPVDRKVGLRQVS